MPQELTPPVPEEAPTAPVPGLPDFIRLGSWFGLEQWNCGECPWNTIEGGPDGVYLHWLHKHQLPRTVPALPIAPSEESVVWHGQ